MTVEVGQLREWRGIPTPEFYRSPAEGLRFRIVKFMDNGDVYGEYEPSNPAIFTRAERDFVERCSVVVGPPASPSEMKGRDRT